MPSLTSLLPFVLVGIAAAQKIVLTNDDGWAVAQIRAAYDALSEAGYEVILSAPAQNGSGGGGLSVPALPTVIPCEFNSCPEFSPAEGFNASDPHLNYVNALPADAAHYGVTTLAPKFWGGQPDLVVSGPNVGNNVGIDDFISGTLGAAARGVQDGVPAIGFSGSRDSTAEEAWTALTSSPTSPSVLAAHTYADLTTQFLAAVFSQPPASPALLPSDTILNVNFPTLSSSCQAGDVQWVLTRAFQSLLDSSPDVETCNNGGLLPQESDVVSAGCYATVSVLDPSTKLDADKDVQEDVLSRLSHFEWTCFSG